MINLRNMSPTSYWVFGSISALGIGFGIWYFVIRDNESGKSESSSKTKSSSKSSPISNNTVRYEIGDDPWDMRYKDDVIASGIKAKLLSPEKAIHHVRKIRNAKGWIDTESDVLNVIRSLQSKVQLSQLSRVFFDTYKDKKDRDLYKYIRSFFSSWQIEDLKKEVDKLNDY